MTEKCLRDEGALKAVSYQVFAGLGPMYFRRLVRAVQRAGGRELDEPDHAAAGPAVRNLFGSGRAGHRPPQPVAGSAVTTAETEAE
jgi:hypothetical protein